MPVDPDHEIMIHLPAGEWNDVVARYQTSISWSQQILAKILKQAQVQQQAQTQQQAQDQESTVSPLGNRRSRNAATVLADGGSDPAA